MKQLKNKIWWECAGVRSLKTMAQTAVALIGTNVLISEIDWAVVCSTSVVAGLLSLLTSIAGLPEVPTEDEINDI